MPLPDSLRIQSIQCDWHCVDDDGDYDSSAHGEIHEVSAIILVVSVVCWLILTFALVALWLANLAQGSVYSNKV